MGKKMHAGHFYLLEDEDPKAPAKVEKKEVTAKDVLKPSRTKRKSRVLKGLL